MLYTLTGFVTFTTLYEMPVFAPNDFFWQNHWKEGEEQKWEAFARVVREIIAD